MRRFGFGVVVSVVALVSASAALGADLDYPTEMRGSYNDWDAPADPLIEFSAGLRYMYSMGGTNVNTSGYNSSKYSVAAANSTTSDTTHYVEGFLRLDDLATDTFLSAFGGYSIHMDTGYSNQLNANGQTTLGRAAYAVVDFGYLPVQLGSDDTGLKLGGIIGYQYINDAPTIGGSNYNPISGTADIGWSTGSSGYSVPVNHADHSLNINALRLGVAGKAKLGPFDIIADVAAIPYASVTGVLGAHSFSPVNNGSYTTYKATESKLNGSAWGASTDIMLGYNVTDNMAIRFGGRATYLRGKGDLTYGLADVSHPEDSDPLSPGYEIGPSSGGTYYLTPERIDSLSLWRYGLLAEISVKF